MSHQQLQPTAEKSVQTHDSSGSNTCIGNNHTENATTEVANTLVSMATGRQRTIANMKQLVGRIRNDIELCFVDERSSLQNVISVPNPSSSLPVLSLAEYTTARGVPTAVALANQAKLTVRKQADLVETIDDNDMSTDEYNDTGNQSDVTVKTRRSRTNRTLATSLKHQKQSSVEPIQYGPIIVKPRKHIAPTLANGRRSKDEPVGDRLFTCHSLHLSIDIFFSSSFFVVFVRF
jgi:hypothetical protein